ncbi:MAG: hypothetical protein ACE5OZ_12300 [Candidatus Heimdallarchaeota archaeon]
MISGTRNHSDSDILNLIRRISMLDLEKDENGCSLGFTMTGKRFKAIKYIITRGGTLQNLQIVWKGRNEPSEEILLEIIERKHLSAQVWEEKPELAHGREMEMPGMTVFQCIRIIRDDG